MPRKTIRTTKKSPATVKTALRKRRLLSKRTASTKTTTKKKPNAARVTHKKTFSTPPPPALVPESFHNTTPSLSSIKLSSQKPFWLLAQWHLSLSDLEIWRRRAPGGELTLRLYTEKGQCLQTTAVPGVVRNWHLYTDTTTCAFYVELGYLNKDNQFECLCRSGSVKPLTPKPEATIPKNFRSTQPNPVILKESVQRKLVQSFHVTSAPSYGGS
ncbi:MAG: DUF4912 domain-containing protein [Verrucomicrobiae bacterium]|nr:DUF4912 domain-containing protein [Verrucomicrobiae bacterium]